ncbi:MULTISPECIES: dipicolinate synthase subunit DpsA [Bacillus]|uniref:Dipicolinate synthase subunit A n=2 Tax=Bacillus TaxID=1386 RepID=A0A0M4FTQ9_9BACI|nr:MULTISPECIES: dipicolinate synthase subunit DpsA [Bacillus]ALC83460.1 dipicolinate synthase subunit A [Bacillus gobiensis]MBP1082414.1 dipicolinate synthase subunit A [Bacillus capparidis]MED1097334.1 dipicolinate synthase subunit DpsA [Bacillus capparidis]
MLNGMHILIAGGDSRHIELIKKLTGADARVFLTGFEDLPSEFENASKVKIDDINLSIVDSIILPVSGIHEKGKVEASFSQNDVFITKEIISKTKNHCVLYSGISTPYLDDIVKSTNRSLVTIFDRDDVAILNSIPTAEGALKLAIEHTDVTIHGSNLLVLGFGRVGMTVARTFSSIGAKVKVCVRNAADAARITEMGLEPLFFDTLEKEVSANDICINTIPKQVLTSSIISKMPDHTLIIDLASKPGGTDFQFAQKQGIKALWALGLPGKVAPKTAGEIMANVLFDLLKEQKIQN